MGAITDISHLLVHTGFSLLIFITVLRGLLQLSRADFYNPITQMLVKVTDPFFLPIQRLLGGSLSPIVLTLLWQLCATSAIIALNGLPFPSIFILLSWAVIGSIGLIINIYLFAIIITIVLSWIAPSSYHPSIILLRQLTEPVMLPFRKMIPSLGGLDLSPLLVFLVINVLQIMLRHVAVAAHVIPALVIGI